MMGAIDQCGAEFNTSSTSTMDLFVYSSMGREVFTPLSKVLFIHINLAENYFGIGYFFEDSDYFFGKAFSTTVDSSHYNFFFIYIGLIDLVSDTLGDMLKFDRG